MSQGPPNFQPGNPGPEIASKIEEKSVKNDESHQAESTRNAAEPRLEAKMFFWDSIIFYLSFAILGLNFSNIVVDFLRPEPNAVACYTSLNTSRDQAAYINNYCNDYLPFSENFTLALVVQGAVLLAPHYLWKVYFSARVDFFFSHAAKLETLRDRDTGQYPHKNFNVVDYMDREFSEKMDILIGYIAKLLAQFCGVMIVSAASIVIFQDFNIEFDCPDEDKPEHPLFQRVKCSYAKLRFVSILRYVDYGLLLVSLIVLLYGLYWCVIRSHSELEYEDTSKFCYQSCINSKFYKFTKRHRLKSDQHFLLVSLFATNAGLGRVFKSVQIATKINHELSAHLESLDSFKSMMCSSEDREAEMEENVLRNFGFNDDESLDRIMYDICKGIRAEQMEIYGDELNSFVLGALDITCGYHSYLFSIARWQLHVISIVLDPYYSNQTEIFKSEEHHGGVKIMRLPTNLFGLEAKHKFDFTEKIEYYTGYKVKSKFKENVEVNPGQPPIKEVNIKQDKEVNIKPDNKDIKMNPDGEVYIKPGKKVKPARNRNVSKFSLVVIGPMDQKRKVNSVNQIIEMHSRASKYFEDGSVMLILRPLEVQGTCISKRFIKWEPESTRFWIKSPSPLNDLRKWLKDSKVITVDHSTQDYGTILVKCGQVDCKFELKIFFHNKVPIRTPFKQSALQDSV